MGHEFKLYEIKPLRATNRRCNFAGYQSLRAISRNTWKLARTYGTESNNAGGAVTVNVRCSNGSKFSVQIRLESTVGSFKSVLAQNCDIPAEQQRLIYKGRILKDDQSLESYGEIKRRGGGDQVVIEKRR
ncbi:hypothetical protein LguiB_009720 [Lonicera macranthoides]